MVDVPHPPSGGHTYRVTPSPSRSGQRPGLSQLGMPSALWSTSSAASGCFPGHVATPDWRLTLNDGRIADMEVVRCIDRAAAELFAAAHNKDGSPKEHRRKELSYRCAALWLTVTRPTRLFERPEHTTKCVNDTSNRSKMRHMASQDASASCLVNAYDRILGTHRRPATVSRHGNGKLGAVSGWIPPRLRPLLGAELSNITRDGLEQLIGVPENQNLEFKRQAYESTDRQKKEAAYDIAAMANASGGLILIGIEEDGSSTAAKIAPIPRDEDIEAWLQRVVASRVSPSLSINTHRVEIDNGIVQLVSVAPSTRKPHAVSVGDDALRYPVRSGTTKRYLSEPEVADFYYRRNSDTATIQEKAYKLHRAAKELHSTAVHTEPAAWLVLSIVPTMPGNLDLEQGIERQWQKQVNSDLQDLAACQARILTRASIGFRSIELSDTPDNDMRVYETHARLNLDGSGFLLVGYPYACQKSNDGPLTTILDEEIVVNVINGLGVLIRHASSVGAIGDVTIGAQFFAPCRIALHHPRNSQQPRIRGTRSVNQETPIALRSAPLEPVSTPGNAVLSLARNIVSDLFSPFGLAQPFQITPEGALDIRHFDRRYHSVIRTWATQTGIEVIGDS